MLPDGLPFNEGIGVNMVLCKKLLVALRCRALQQAEGQLQGQGQAAGGVGAGHLPHIPLTQGCLDDALHRDTHTHTDILKQIWGK